MISLDCARSMAMVAFPCPPLPVLGSRMEDGASAVLNSHDVICTLMATAFKMGDAGVNARREARQRELEMRYREAVAGMGCDDFDRVYGAMALFTHEYIQTYVLHDNASIRVLELDRATPPIQAQIRGYTRARAILMEGAPSTAGDLRSCVRECAALLRGGVVGGAEPLHAGVAAVAGQE